MKEYHLDIESMSPAEFSLIQKSHKQIVEAENKRIEELEKARKEKQQEYINKIKRARKGR